MKLSFILLSFLYNTYFLASYIILPKAHLSTQ